MKSLLAKISSTAAGIVVLLVGCTLAGLGLTVFAVLALFALAAFGLALLAHPFLEMLGEAEINRAQSEGFEGTSSAT